MKHKQTSDHCYLSKHSRMLDFDSTDFHNDFHTSVCDEDINREDTEIYGLYGYIMGATIARMHKRRRQHGR